jgi:hypothetical protein
MEEVSGGRREGSLRRHKLVSLLGPKLALIVNPELPIGREICTAAKTLCSLLCYSTRLLLAAYHSS